MSTEPPERQRAPTGTIATQKTRWTPRRIVMLVLLAYTVLLALLNLDSVDVNFVFFKTEASLFVVIVLALALGFLFGWLFDDLRARRRRRAG